MDLGSEKGASTALPKADASVFDMDGNHLTYPLNVYVEPAFPEHALSCPHGGFPSIRMMT